MNLREPHADRGVGAVTCLYLNTRTPLWLRLQSKAVMAEENREADQFINEEIESIPHLEALLLLWNSRPKEWSLKEMANALYVSECAQSTLQNLRQRALTASNSVRNRYSYDPGFTGDRLMEEVDRVYRHDLIRISTMIHSKAPAAVREFVRAFKFKQD
jgi:hypothetical protein